MCSRIKIENKKNGGDIVNLNIGEMINIPSGDGKIIHGAFLGFARVESFERYWKKRTDKIFVVPITKFTESRENPKDFELKETQAVVFLAAKDITGKHGLFMTTKQAGPPVSTVHHRMPAFVPVDYKPKSLEEKVH